jgi:hypothetical protein
MKTTSKSLVIGLVGAIALAGCGSDSKDTINLRVAHLSPNAPAVDFCVKLGSGSFTGPVLKGLGVTAGLAYSQVTKYLTLDAGQYTARLVAPNAADCSTSLASLPDYALPSLPGGTYATAAAVGLVGGTPAFTVKPFVDDYRAPAGQVALRFVHASPGTPAVDVGVGSGANFTALFSNVAFPDIGSGTGIDANGYYAAAPLTNATVSARVHGTTTDALVIPGVSLPAGATTTAFAIGILGNATTPLSVLGCLDNAPPVGNLADCFVAP